MHTTDNYVIYLIPNDDSKSLKLSKEKCFLGILVMTGRKSNVNTSLHSLIGNMLGTL